MIIRIWRGWTGRSDADAYRDYMTNVALPGYREVDGNLAVYMAQRDEKDRTEFVMISAWTSLDAIRAFAGDDLERAVFYPRDDDYLIDREWRVTHYDVYGGWPPEA